MRTTRSIISSIMASAVNELKKVLPLFKEADPLDKTAEQAVSIAIGPEIKQLERLAIEAAKQGCPLTASSKRDSSIGSIEDWGFLYLQRYPNAAIGGRYKAIFTGTGTAAAGVQYIEQNTGFVFILEAEVSGAGEGIVQSVGNDGETLLNIDTELFAQQTTGLDQIIKISEILTYPQDSETVADYLAAVLEAIRITPHGGAKGDYIRWAKEITGIYKVFPYTRIDSGSIYLMQLRTDDNLTGAVTADQIAAVEAKYLTEDVMASGEIEVLNVLNRIYNITVEGLTDPTKESAVEDALKGYFDAKFPFISGVDNENTRTDRVTKAEIGNVIYQAVFPASFSDVLIEVAGNPVNDEYLPSGTIGTAEVDFD